MIALFLVLIAGISTHKSAEKIYIDQPVSYDITVDCPPGAQPDLAAFKASLQTLAMPTMTLDAYNPTYDKASNTVKLHFELSPKRIGRVIFAPGFLSFSPRAGQVLLPAMEVETVATALQGPPFVFPIPLYPEKKISLSPETRARLFAPELLKQKRLEARFEFHEYEKAWNLLIGALVAASVSILLFWALVQYELFQRAKRWFMPKHDPLQGYLKVVYDNALLPKERWRNLGYVLKYKLSKREGRDMSNASINELIALIEQSEKLQPQEKKKSLELLKRIEEVCYGGQNASDDEWNKALSVI
jgi:hypothetical protein